MIQNVFDRILYGVKATGWELGRVLKAMWKLLSDSPARRDLYINLTRSDNFPLMFCQTRWVELLMFGNLLLVL